MIFVQLKKYKGDKESRNYYLAHISEQFIVGNDTGQVRIFQKVKEHEGTVLMF